MSRNSPSDDTLCVIPPETPLEGFASLAVPTYRASTIVFPDAAAYRNRMNRGADGYTYGLSGTPTSRTLEAQIAALHGAERAVVVPSGLSAITVPMMTLLASGDHLLVADNAYPPVKSFARNVLAKMGIEVEYFDPTLPEDLEARLRPGTTRLVWIEAPGSTSMEICDIPALSALAHAAGARIGIDNTWATALCCKPLDLGIDIVAEALTKYAGGHSDILMGAIILRDMELFRSVKAMLSDLGVGVSPDECALALRGMQTMAVRLEHSGRVARELADWLQGRAEVAAVLHPALPAFPGHALWARDFTGSTGVFTLRLDGISAEKIDRALDTLKTFAIGASWGGTRSLMAPMSLAGGRQVMEIDEETTWLRLSIGLEGKDDLEADLDRFLCAL